MNKNKLKLCLVQIQGRESPELNRILLKKNLEKCLKFKPNIIFTPECLNVMTSNTEHLKKVATTQEECPVLKECVNFAKKQNIYLSIGSLLLRIKNSNKLVNRSFFINNKGKIINFYDKINLFDVEINKNEKYHESNIFKKGNKFVVANSPWGEFGLSICYDVRFPELYRKLLFLGSKFLLIPAAFTRPTGKSHWKVLLRSRAIENTCFVIAAAQCGTHHAKRKTHGHSLIIDPWGKVIIEGKNYPKIFFATLDLNILKPIRKRFKID